MSSFAKRVDFIISDKTSANSVGEAYLLLDIMTCFIPLGLVWKCESGAVFTLVTSQVLNERDVSGCQCPIFIGILFSLSFLCFLFFSKLHEFYVHGVLYVLK